jgi:hypothetical protein
VAVIQDLIPEAQKHGRGVMQGTWKGIIANNPSAFGKQVYVIIPDISKDHRWGPCNWQPQDNMNLPVVGNSCLVVFDNQRAPWVASWWTGQPPNVVNGQWIKGVNGAAVWRPITLPDLPIVPSCKVYKSSPIGTPGNPTFPVPFDAEEFDPTGMHDPVVNNSRVTITTPGPYLIIFTAAFTANANGFHRLGYLTVNTESPWSVMNGVVVNQQGGGTSRTQTLLVRNLKAGDYIQAGIYQDSGANLSVGSDGYESGPWMSVTYQGRIA